MGMEDYIRECIATPPRPQLPDSTIYLGSVEASWEEVDPGIVRISASGGTQDDRHFVDKFLWTQLASAGYERHSIPIDYDYDEPLDPDTNSDVIMKKR